MKNTIEAALDESLNKTLNGDLGPDELVAEAMGFKLPPGTPVAITEDPTYPWSGQRGVVKGKMKNGLIEVEMPGGATVPMQANLLIPLS